MRIGFFIPGGRRHHVEEIHLKHMCKLLFGGKVTEILNNGEKCITTLGTLKNPLFGDEIKSDLVKDNCW